MLGRLTLVGMSSMMKMRNRLRSYLRFPDKKEVQRRSLWSSLLAGRSLLRSKQQGIAPAAGWRALRPSEAMYSVSETSVSVCASPLALVFTARPLWPHGESLFNGRPSGAGVAQHIASATGAVRSLVKYSVRALFCARYCLGVLSEGDTCLSCLYPPLT